MFSLKPELLSLRERELIAPASADKLIAIEERRLLSAHYELRIATYLGVLLILGGVGELLRQNLDRIGPVTIVVGIAVAAMLLYAFAWSRKKRGTFSIFHEYVVLLASLLVAADVGYAEKTFDLLGSRGLEHLIVIAIFHAAVAYLFDSKLVLSSSLMALAAWFGIDRTFDRIFNSTWEVGRQALLCAAVVMLWREIHRRAGGSATLIPPFEHFAANLAGIGACMWTLDRNYEWVGYLLAFAVAAVIFAIAIRRHSELFLLYAIGYALWGMSAFVVREFHDVEAFLFIYFIFAFGAAIVTLFVAHMKWRFDE